MARQTLQPIAELSLEIVDNEAVVPPAIDLPLLLAGDLLRQLLQFRFTLGRHLIDRLVQDAVEVLVKPIQQEYQELLRVMLIGPAELWRVHANRSL